MFHLRTHKFVHNPIDRSEVRQHTKLLKRIQKRITVTKIENNLNRN
jgi:hypothetical protein